ncbi:type VI protein secretion system component VasK [Herbaspirillum rubrisubalbicans]|nr:type VI protein secretion system component VasK [Herbaspirillum rubrisubalbicans]
MRGYMENLSKLRTRLNTIKNQGDTGPGAKQLMQQTLEGSGSELSDSLKFVDEEMLPGLNDQQKTTLRPLLVRPLVQGFNALVRPTEGEVNKIWRAQVYEPFQNNLAAKYPFSPNSKIEANSGEIGTVFGENGAISKFVTTTMGPLVVRRGDTLSPRKWADMGITLSPAITTNFAEWISTPAGAGGNGGSAAADAQTVFQIQPQPAPGALEYTIEIDGQQLRYRNTQAQWTNFVWPNPQGAPGARVTAVTYDGRTVEVANQPGRFGLERLINTAQRKRKDNGVFELSWTNDGVTVVVNLKIISSAEVSGNANGTARGTAGLRGLKLPETIAGGEPVASPPNTPAAVAPTAQTQTQQQITTGATQ